MHGNQKGKKTGRGVVKERLGGKYQGEGKKVTEIIAPSRGKQGASTIGGMGGQQRIMG